MYSYIQDKLVFRTFLVILVQYQKCFAIFPLHTQEWFGCFGRDRSYPSIWRNRLSAESKAASWQSLRKIESVKRGALGSFLKRFAEVTSMCWMLPVAAFESRGHAWPRVAEPGALDLLEGKYLLIVRNFLIRLSCKPASMSWGQFGAMPVRIRVVWINFSRTIAIYSFSWPGPSDAFGSNHFFFQPKISVTTHISPDR